MYLPKTSNNYYHFSEDGQDDYSMLCKVCGFLMQFSMLTSFFWMNVLSYDVFRKFTRFRPRNVDGINAKVR